VVGVGHEDGKRGDIDIAYQVMTLSAIGEAETPAGGSVCMRCETMRGQ